MESAYPIWKESIARELSLDNESKENILKAISETIEIFGIQHILTVISFDTIMLSIAIRNIFNRLDILEKTKKPAVRKENGQKDEKSNKKNPKSGRNIKDSREGKRKTSELRRKNA